MFVLWSNKLKIFYEKAKEATLYIYTLGVIVVGLVFEKKN
jgi:hypothetical protein